MVPLPTEVSSTHDIGGDSAADTTAGDALLRELSQLWQAHRRCGLVVRHRTGLVLNSQFGPPTERQTYRSAALKDCSKRLGVSESELSRMRWFAHHFESLEALGVEHPKITTWTSVKELLATLRQPDAARRERAVGDIVMMKPPDARPVSRVVEAIRAVRASVTCIDLELADADRATLVEEVGEMLEVVGKHLGLRYRLEPAAPDDALIPPASPAHDLVAGRDGTA